MRRQQASCPDRIGMGVSSRPHPGKPRLPLLHLIHHPPVLLLPQ